MAVMIRLSRAGAKKRPLFHIVAAEKTACRDGKYLEYLGQYNPKKTGAERAVAINLPSIENWMAKGAIPSDTIKSLLKDVKKASK